MRQYPCVTILQHGSQREHAVIGLALSRGRALKAGVQKTPYLVLTGRRDREWENP
jgi:hypothetical protein